MTDDPKQQTTEPEPEPEPEDEPCQTCEGSGEVFIRRDKRGRIDFIDGSPTGETMRCDMCNGEGFRL